MTAAHYDPEKEKEQHKIENAFKTVEDFKRSPCTTKEAMISMVEAVTDSIEEKMNVDSALDVTISEKKRELKELHGFESEHLNTAAMIAAREEMLRDLDDKIAEKKAQAAVEERECQESIKFARQSAEKQAKQIADSIKVEREEADYRYNLERTRKIENDQWEDEKNKRVQAIADKEDSLDMRELQLDEKENELKIIQSQIDSIKAERDAAYADGEKAGRSAVEKEKCAEINSLRTKHSYDMSLIQKELDMANGTIEDLHDRIDYLTDMLNAANEKNQELAKEVVVAMSAKNPVYNVTSTDIQKKA